MGRGLKAIPEAVGFTRLDMIGRNVLEHHTLAMSMSKSKAASAPITMLFIARTLS